ncbi:MAG: hypothetical protein RQ824_05135 [bacterium]|nr:hypothetical protein [bacterium]
MRCKVLLIALIIISFCSNAYAIFAPEGKITFRIIDEQGLPIAGVNASAGFRFPDIKYGGITGTRSETLTSSDGLLVASGKTMDQVGYSAKKDGYYISQGTYHFKDSQNDRWLPWNPTVEVLLRKIENPMPMYQKDMEMSPVEFPVVGKEVGFDLIEYDWVSPYGKGKHPDIILKLTRQVVNNDNFESNIHITFPNKYDGLLLIKDDRKGGSIFKLPRYAPETGYQNSLTRHLKSFPGKPLITDSKDDNNFIFRIRSEEEDGKFVKAMYGKIYGDFLFEPRFSKTAVFGFKYFLNPDYTRNLEEGRNLFRK